nr:hypothetical protein [Bacilli bacterium]
MILQQSMGIIHLFRVLFTVIDRVVYWAIMEIYNLIDQITRINIFDESTLSEFSTRIYTIIGVLMLFKLAFSIINYIVDPDKLADNKKGFSSIVKNIIIMLALIVTVPLIFKYAMALQYVVVSDNTIGRLITGKEGGSTANVGDNMSVAILSGFIHPDSGVAEGCENWSQECENALSKYNLNQTYHNAYYGERGYNYLLQLATSTETMGDGNYVIVYNVILSTLVGGFTAWILLMFCIDIAVRIVKLGFLQLIAPIPIVTYMDDGGQGIFKKWVKVCTSTYADLFIRLAAINFAIYVIQVFLINQDTGGNALMGTFKMCEWSFNAGTLTAVCDKKPGVFVRLFLILGTLMFAKQLPKLIEEITGLKLDGGFTLNPMKKLSEVPLVGGIGSKALGLAGRTAGNLAAGLAGGIWGATGGAALGAVGGAIKNAYDGSKLQGYVNAGGNKLGGAYDVANKFMGNRLGRIGADFSGTIGGTFGNSKDKKLSLLNNFVKAEKAMEDRAIEQIKNGAAGKLSEKYTSYIEAINAARQAGDANKAAELQNKLNAWMGSNDPNGAASQYIDFITSGKFTDDLGNVVEGDAAKAMMKYSDGREFKDGTMAGSMMERFETTARVAGIEKAADASDMHSKMGKAKGEISGIETSKMAVYEAKKK